MRSRGLVGQKTKKPLGTVASGWFPWGYCVFWFQRRLTCSAMNKNNYIEVVGVCKEKDARRDQQVTLVVFVPIIRSDVHFNCSLRRTLTYSPARTLTIAII